MPCTFKLIVSLCSNNPVNSCACTRHGFLKYFSLSGKTINHIHVKPEYISDRYLMYRVRLHYQKGQSSWLSWMKYHCPFWILRQYQLWSVFLQFGTTICLNYHDDFNLIRYSYIISKILLRSNLFHLNVFLKIWCFKIKYVIFCRLSKLNYYSRNNYALTNFNLRFKTIKKLFRFNIYITA